MTILLRLITEPQGCQMATKILRVYPCIYIDPAVPCSYFQILPIGIKHPRFDVSGLIHCKILVKGGLQRQWRGILMQTLVQTLCIWQSDASPFCENYAKLCFDAKDLEKRLNRWWWNFWCHFFFFFSKKVHFLVNILH